MPRRRWNAGRGDHTGQGGSDMADGSSIFRLRIHRGPFYFGPEYLANQDQWQSSFSKLATTLPVDEKIKPDSITSEGFGLRCFWTSLEFVVDAYSGTFDLSEGSPFVEDDLSDKSWPGVCCRPSRLRTEIAHCSVPEQFRAVVYRQILPWGEELYRQMRMRFERALAEGSAEIQARPLSPLSEFVRIEPDALRYFVLDDNQRDDVDRTLDTARASNGERLFSLGVLPRQLTPTSRSDLASMQIEQSAPPSKKGPKGRKYDWHEIGKAIEELNRELKGQQNYTLDRLHEATIDHLGEKKVPSRSHFMNYLQKFYPHLRQ